MTLPTALSGGSTTSYQIVATPTSENVTISYSMKNAPDTLAVSSAVEEEETVHYLDVSATARATGTLCIGVNYENLSATYEIAVTVDPNAT